MMNNMNNDETSEAVAEMYKEFPNSLNDLSPSSKKVVETSANPRNNIKIAIFLLLNRVFVLFTETNPSVPKHLTLILKICILQIFEQ